MIKPDRTVSTTCPYCGVGCTLELHLRDDFIYKVTSPFDSPVNHGNLCVKGRFGYDYIYHPKRVLTPLIRKVPQEPGSRTQAFNREDWREVSWDEALDYVADRLTAIYRRDGSDAMAVYCCAKATNEDNYLLQKMYRSLFRTNNIDHCTRLCHAGSVVALQMGRYRSTSPWRGSPGGMSSTQPWPGRHSSSAAGSLAGTRWSRLVPSSANAAVSVSAAAVSATRAASRTRSHAPSGSTQAPAEEDSGGILTAIIVARPAATR